MRLIFITRFQQGYVQNSGNNLFEHEKVFQITSTVLATERSRKSFTFQEQSSEVFCKEDVLRNFVKFIGQHLWQSLFLNKVAVL